MELTRKTLIGNGSTTLYNVNFNLGYIDTNYVFVYLDGNEKENQLQYVWRNSNQIELNQPVADGVKFYIRRVIPRDMLVNNYSNGALLRETNLNNSYLQTLMILEEVQDGFITVEDEFRILAKVILSQNLDMSGYRINNLASPTEDSDAVNKAYLNARLQAGNATSNELTLRTVLVAQGFSGDYGFFSTGFEYNQLGDIGIDTNGNSWIYVGAGAPNKVVAAGTVPSVATGYEQVTFNAASGVINANGGSVQDFIDRDIFDRSDIRNFGAISGQPCNAAIQSAITATGSATVDNDSFVIVLSTPVDVPLGAAINFNGNSINKSLSFTPNADNTIFNHSGDAGKVLNVSYPDISATERLIGYQDGVNRCEEYGCSTGRGNNFLIKFQGVENTNVSRTLESQSELGNTYSEKTIKVIVDAVSGGVAEFRRARHFPSYCKIKGIKVTDLNGSPDLYFDLAMREGASFAYPFIRSRDTSDIDEQTNIDWIYDSSDDILSFNVINYKATDTQIEVEITYTNEKFASLSSVWSYQSEFDFLRPHAFGSTNRAGAIRSPEYRSYISGGTLDVRTATPSRNKDDNYNLPNVTMPTPSGTQDTSQSSELKFYFRLSAGAALSAGATHALFRLYQSNRQIKCTVINGFLSQAPDWVQENHLAVAFQPDIEVDWPAQTDRDNPIELLIPLDKKMLQQASQQAKKNDFEYYYLTFFANLPSHVAIEWADVWEWDFQFIKGA